METEEKEPLFTKKRVIIVAVVLLVLLILGYFLFFRGKQIAVERIELAQTNITLLPKETFSLKANIFPPDATNRELEYTTTDATIVTVSNSGLITAINNGEAQIVVKAKGTNIVAACDIKVTTTPEVVTGLKFSKNELTINKGQPTLLTLTVIPSTAKVPSLTFTSSDNNIVTVDANGYIMGKNVGTANIIVTGTNSNGMVLSTTIKIIVVEATNDTNPNPVIIVESITLNKSAINMEIGHQFQFVPTVKTNGQIPSITWKSETIDENNNPTNGNLVVSVDSTGRVTALMEGKARITATAGDKSASAFVTVIKSTTDDGDNTPTGDVTGPTISPLVPTSAPNTNGWYKEVNILVSANDASGVSSLVYCITSSTCTPKNAIDNGTTIKLTSKNQRLVVQAKDKKGNISTLISNYFNIDNVAPTCNFGGKTGTITYQSSPYSVGTVIHGYDDASGIDYITLPTGQKSYSSDVSYTIAYNNNHTAVVTDKAGNIGQCSIMVYGIKQDNGIPTCSISTSPSSVPNNLLLTIISNNTDLNSYPYSWNSSTVGFTNIPTRTVTTNGTYYAYIKDIDGNVGSCHIDINSFIPDTTYPTITMTALGTKGYNDWYINNKIVVKASINDDNPSTITTTYCATLSYDCNPINPYPATGITLGNGTWLVTIKATDGSGKTTTKTSRYKVDLTKPTCYIDTVNPNWEEVKGLMVTGYDTFSNMKQIKLWTGLYITGSSALINVSNVGTYKATCEDAAGNKTDASINIVLRSEYSYRRCLTCETKYGNWTSQGASCYATVPTLSSKALAESLGATTYYYCGGGCGDASKPVSCLKYTRTATSDCTLGCKTDPSGWGEWSPYQYYPTIPPTSYFNTYERQEAISRVTYNKQPY